jgi:hypothetical protein
VTIAPGDSQVVTFVLAWYVPNRRKTWERSRSAAHPKPLCYPL